MRFRKKPIEVDAIQLTERTEINTREGTLYGYPGDWIITGVRGEKYPISDDILFETYTPVGKDACSICEYGNLEIRPCDSYETCVFKRKAGEQE